MQVRAAQLLKCIADGTDIYGVIDGNHRTAALLLLAVDPDQPDYSLDTSIAVVPHLPTVHIHPSTRIARALI